MSTPIESVRATREYLHKVCGFSSEHETMQGLDALIAEATAKQAVIESYEQGDKARIEFLANHPESMPYLEDGIWRIPYLSQGEGGFGGGVSSYHRTLSGCIDAAMNHKTK